MDLAKLIFILNMGFVHPAVDGTLDVWKDDKSPAIPVISSDNDHAWLLARRSLEAGAILSAFMWSKKDPSAREVVLTGLGTMLMRDAVFNLSYYTVRWGEPNRAGTHLIDFRLGFVTLRALRGDNGPMRLAEFVVGLVLIKLSEI